ncbi:DUF6404 family protein [bacterium]|nr:DUF6404 family protein [bacterium]
MYPEKVVGLSESTIKTSADNTEKDKQVTESSTVFEEKYTHAMAELENSAIWGINYAPPLHMSARMLGLKILSAHYSSFLLNFACTDVYSYILWVINKYSIFPSQRESISFLELLLHSLAPGVVFGLYMAYSYKYSAKKIYSLIVKSFDIHDGHINCSTRNYP